MASRNSAHARMVEEEARKYLRDVAGGSAFEFETVSAAAWPASRSASSSARGAGGTMTRARAVPQVRREAALRGLGRLKTRDGLAGGELVLLSLHCVQLRCSAHTVNLGALDSDPLVGQPYMALGFLPYGTLDSFAEEMRRDQYIPNRVFWSPSCVARILMNAEEVDEDDIENYEGVQDLQDYWSSEGHRNPGIDHNTLAVGRVSASPGPASMRALKPGDRLIQLDEDLRALVARCLTAEPLNRPTLGELVAACHAAVYTKDSAFYAEEG
ncbi:hypothetical protein DL768_002331 [Monosporascus sp. mg162]|nr:hypothetical protein DL768_002331 [Monosporascus sp. mg162]